MTRRPLAALAITTLLAGTATGCFYGHTPATKHRANVYNTVSIVTGLAIAIGITAALENTDQHCEGDCVGQGVANIGAALVGPTLGAPFIFAGLGGYVLNGVTANDEQAPTASALRSHRVKTPAPSAWAARFDR